MPQHPPGLPVLMIALTDETDTGSQDEITLQLLPYKMKLILTEPDVVTGSGQNVFLGLRNKLKFTLQSARANV
jgi:hypothetical protein